MKWQVQINADNTHHCSLPVQLCDGVPFVAEVDGKQVHIVQHGRQVSLLRDIGSGLSLEEHVTILTQKRSPLPHGRQAVQVLYATHTGEVHSCHACVGLAAVVTPPRQADNMPPAEIISPLTGKVIKVLVARGTRVRKGAALLIVEAMKMENIVHAEGEGVVAALNVKVGDAVRSGDVLLVLRREN